MQHKLTRKSKQREAILRVLRSTTSHPTADWIYDQVRKEIPNISLGTVYRNLKLLKEEGEVLDLDMAGGFNRFDGNSKNHYHFRCEDCGQVFDIDEPVDKGIEERVARKTGFRVSHHRLEFRGLCDFCQPMQHS
ncbi:transcriptional repressor [Chloroflexota bacterium]